MINPRIKIKVKTKGFDKLNADMDRAISQGLLKGAYEVERTAKIYAPYDTGTLSRSIKTSPIRKTSLGWSITISPSVFYADIMEQPGNVRKRGQRPYMRPALMDSLNKI